MPSGKAVSGGFARCLKRLIANWPLNEERAETKAEELRSLWKEVGGHRFEAAVGRIVNEHKGDFFPTIGEFRSFLPAEGQSWWRDPNCPDCHGDGFKEVTPQVLMPNSKWQDREVTRCRREGCLHVA